MTDEGRPRRAASGNDREPSAEPSRAFDDDFRSGLGDEPFRPPQPTATDDDPWAALMRPMAPAKDLPEGVPTAVPTPAADDPWAALLQPWPRGSVQPTTPSASAPAPATTPEIEDDSEITSIRPALNPDWYRSDDASTAASVWDNEQPWQPPIGQETWANDPAPAQAFPAEHPEHADGPIDDGRRRLRSSLLLTVASAVLPGAGLLGAKKLAHKAIGAAAVVAALGGAGALYLQYRRSPARFVAQFTDPNVLTTLTFVAIVIGLLWVGLITATNLVTRPMGLSRAKRALSALVVGVLCFAVGVPTALAARYSRDTTLAIEKVAPVGHEEVKSSTRPTLEGKDPWANIPRVNILLLGADGSASRAEINKRESIRTDTIMVASIDTKTGAMTLIQIPRNVQFTPFPAGSEMAQVFPDGFRGPERDDGNYFINAIWAKVTLDHPELFGDATYRGAEALKQGVEGVTGLKMDYFLMLNMDGVKELINAMGGVTVNVNDRYPIGEDKNRGIPPSGWLEKGPSQHLNGYEAMWFARSRSRHDDYDRMARQSCPHRRDRRPRQPRQPGAALRSRRRRVGRHDRHRHPTARLPRDGGTGLPRQGWEAEPPRLRAGEERILLQQSKLRRDARGGRCRHQRPQAEPHTDRGCQPHETGHDQEAVAVAANDRQPHPDADRGHAERRRRVCVRRRLTVTRSTDAGRRAAPSR